MIVHNFYQKEIKFKPNIFFPEIQAGGSVLLSWKSRQEGGLVLQEIQVRGGLKNDPIRQGNVDFFWNNPFP